MAICRPLQSHRMEVLVLLFGCGLSMVAGCNEPTPRSPAPNMTRAVAIRAAMGGSAESSSDTSGGLSQGPQPTGWATLKGTFKVVGSAPSPTKLNISKDEQVCAPGDRAVFSEEAIVGPQGELKNVVLYLTSDLPSEEPWVHASAAPGKTDEVEFDQKECVFLSHVLAFQTSQPLKILNSDPVGHNAKLDPKSNSTFNQIIPGGSAAIYQPSVQEAAPFPVACSIHPWMNAWMLIRDNGYFAVTDENGAFEIPNLPAGIELEFRVWQEKANFLNDVTLNGEAVTWKKGRFTLNLQPESEMAFDVAIPADILK